MNGRYAALVVLVAAGLVGGCTTTVTGIAQPEPGRVTVTPQTSDPCTLLSDDEASQLGLKGPGAGQKAQPDIRVPASCTWSSADPEASYDGSLQVFFSTNLPIGEYFSTQPAGEEQLGGVTWQHYPSSIADFMCNLAIELSDSSFVGVMSQNLADPSKACALAEEAAPLVAKRLPK